MGITPALAPPEVKDVTLALFGGRKTDIAPSDCPEGLTPDEQDNVFLPGNVQSRPGMGRTYAANKLTPGVAVLYEKSYVQPNDVPLTLVLTADGKLWAEDVVNSPGNPATIATLPAGLYAQSITEFGREYIAFSDLLHGQAVPLQYDGTNLDRVTMDGPGAAPSVADTAPTAYPIFGAGTPGLHVNTFVPNITSASQNGTLCTVYVQGYVSQILYQPGDPVTIAGVGVGGYNGTFPIVAVGLDFVQYNTTAGLAASSGGTATFYSITAVLNSAFQVGVFFVGRSAQIAGAGVAGYNAIFPIRAVGFQISGPSKFYSLSLGVLASQIALADSGGGNLTQLGLSAPGGHQVVVMWLTRQGYLSKPSPATAYFAAGAQLMQVSNVPIGPSNVIARVFGVTGAGGDNFFSILANVTLPNLYGSPTIINSLIIPDNTSTTATFDFSDDALFAATPIDQIGNDLFDQVVIGPVLGFFAFASRLSCWGDYNKIENFLCMAFEGGYLSGVLTGPQGWDATSNVGGTLINGGSWTAGMAWQITGDGTGAQKGQLSQTAYLDSFGDPILSPSTQYSFRLWAKASAAGLNGTFFAKLSSVSAGFTSTASIAINTLSTLGAFTALLAFNNPTPAKIPSDMLLTIYETNLNNGATLTVDELQLIFTQNPFRDSFSRFSYTINPEAFAETTGQLGPSDDTAPILCFTLLRQVALLETAEGVHTFTDNNGEPDEWNVNSLTRATGVLSLSAGDSGKFGTGDAAEDWTILAGRNGVYLFAGAEFWKVSQEISRGSLPQSQDPRICWDDINWAAKQTAVTKNDPTARRAYFAVPVNGATTPNVIFVLDYRELDTAVQIANAAPLHITISGKMRSSDLTRKWSLWNISANDIDILTRPNGVQQLTLAGGVRAGNAYGNIYNLDPSKLTDDDYGAIAPYYTTYAFTDHEQEQALQLGSDGKLVKQIHAFIAGVGLVTITPIVNSLYNFFPPLSARPLTKDTDASNTLRDDIEWTAVGLRATRVFFRISVQPLPGATDVQYRVQKFIVHMMKDPVAPFRQSAI